MPVKKSKRSEAHKKADAAYVERKKESGIRARKFMLNDNESECLRDIEKFIKKDQENIQFILDYIGKR